MLCAIVQAERYKLKSLEVQVFSGKKVFKMSNNPLAIGVMSAHTRFSVSTIRYYEQIGLLPRPGRAAIQPPRACVWGW